MLMILQYLQASTVHWGALEYCSKLRRQPARRVPKHQTTAPGLAMLDLSHEWCVRVHVCFQAVDWWSLGVLTYELLTGASPFTVDGEKNSQSEISKWVTFYFVLHCLIHNVSTGGHRLKYWCNLVRNKSRTNTTVFTLCQSGLLAFTQVCMFTHMSPHDCRKVAVTSCNHQFRCTLCLIWRFAVQMSDEARDTECPSWDLASRISIPPLTLVVSVTYISSGNWL